MLQGTYPRPPHALYVVRCRVFFSVFRRVRELTVAAGGKRAAIEQTDALQPVVDHVRTVILENDPSVTDDQIWDMVYQMACRVRNRLTPASF